MSSPARPGALPHPWVVVFVGFAALALSLTFRAVVGVAMPAWEQSLGWTRDAISTRGAIGLLVMAALFPLVGAIVDRIGARLVLVVGCGFLAAGTALLGAMDEPWQFAVAYGILGSVGFTLVGNTVVSVLVARAFSTKQGFPTGVATSGSTAGQLVLMPVLTIGFAAIGWRATFVTFAAACVGLGIMAFILLRGEGSATPKRTAANDVSLAHSFAMLVRDPGFHAMAVSFFVCGITTTGIIETHFIPFAISCGFPPLPSAIAYSVLAATNFCGMLLCGWLCDRWNRSHLLAGIYAIRGLTFFIALAVADDYPTLIVFAILYGIVEFATLPATAGLAAARYGVGNLGKAMGFLMAAHSIGAALGAWAGGHVFVTTGSYSAAWIGSALSALIAAVVVLFAKDPRHTTPAAGRPAPVTA